MRSLRMQDTYFMADKIDSSTYLRSINLFSHDADVATTERLIELIEQIRRAVAYYSFNSIRFWLEMRVPNNAGDAREPRKRGYSRINQTKIIVPTNSAVTST